jgi:O-antigen ligase
VREASVIALAVIVFNSREAISVSVSARLVQCFGITPAVLALYQIATNTGANIAGELRANGTFAHPNSAAMFFAIAVTASLWQYLDNGRRRLDFVLVVVFSAALVATFSIDGLITVASMLVIFGALRPGPPSSKLFPSLIAALILLSFFATPLGSQRIAKESSSNLAAAERGEANSSLDWRLHKWETLLPEWERAPLVGQGLGTTTTVKRRIGDLYTGEPPHNEFIRYLVETGLAGLVILLAALGLLMLRLAQRRSAERRRPEATANGATLAIVILIGCLVNSLADNTLLNSPTCYAATLIVVAALGIPFQTQHAPHR